MSIADRDQGSALKALRFLRKISPQEERVRGRTENSPRAWK